MKYSDGGGGISFSGIGTSNPIGGVNTENYELDEKKTTPDFLPLVAYGNTSGGDGGVQFRNESGQIDFQA